jgi:hypothetical protein
MDPNPDARGSKPDVDSGRRLSRNGAPSSSHTSDPFLKGFLGPSFDAADYFNSSLPPLKGAGPTSSTSKSGKPPVPLVDLSSQTQTLLSHLDAHTTRMSNTLTQLTDEILRSGSRLAYEVELLRGETLGFAETITEVLRADIERFVPGGLEDAADPVPAEELAQSSLPRAADEASSLGAKAGRHAAREPPYIRQLRTLTLVRERLDSVIKTFGEAMDFVFPPSEVSVGSSFLSVSAPEPGKDHQSSEEKGKEVLKSWREEISKLLADPDDAIKGIEKATERIEHLKELSTVWKGTAEEKGRLRFVESLARMVEDRHRELLRDLETTMKTDVSTKAARAEFADMSSSKGTTGGYGLISQLQKIRSGL